MLDSLLEKFLNTPKCSSWQVGYSFDNPAETFSLKVRNYLQNYIFFSNIFLQNAPLDTENSVLTTLPKVFAKVPKNFRSRSENNYSRIIFSLKKFLKVEESLFKNKEKRLHPKRHL